MKLLSDGIRPTQIVTRKALLNAVAGVVATGGSTNATLHLIAIGKEIGQRLSLDDFDRVSAKDSCAGRPGNHQANTPRLTCIVPVACR